MLAEAGLEVGIYVKKIAGPSPVTGVVEEVGGEERTAKEGTLKCFFLPRIKQLIFEQRTPRP